ncbi:hypothetical protein CHH79_00430 [Bacillus siamensis]|uniref:UPF0715 family protein n=1 Tax=Bacillus siamensis TaxID=659243 RepID=UPI0007EA5C27|nr:UPF0715 family protein [Bacillus siamensis]OAZ59820.1 SPBc2 prophage-derived UPF0715 membrane protein YopD [Bacillus siamensis]PAD65469.1 hypothetical protein CHH79_00430 [Bacillus siamensis]
MEGAARSSLKCYAFTLAFSSMSFGLVFGLYMFVYSGFVPFALVTVVIIACYAFVTYFLFAVPVQFWLRKKPKKCSLIHLFIYTAVAFLAVFLFWCMGSQSINVRVFENFIYYMMSITAALIYWFWDSIFLRKQFFIEKS